MSLRRLLGTLLFTTSALTVLAAAPPLMTVSEVRPGMVGIGRTVFDGTHVEEFKAHIFGVLDNVIGTRRSLILARLEGGPLANTGVIAGMSGSPVYVDGRLIGAVSYALGAFSKEPIAGITPIEEMTDATQAVQIRPLRARVQLDAPFAPDTLMAAFAKALSANRPFADRVSDAQFTGVGAVAGLGTDQLGTLLRPIATPLVMSGFEPEVAGLLSGAFRGQGFIPTAGGAGRLRAGETPYDGPLKPGDAVGVLFVNGDLQLGATGTVTHIDGDRVYAFGHPMYNLGPTEFPMTRAYVYTVLPSLSSSMKLSSTGDVIGTFLQDRATAIAGRLGSAPAMIPISLSLSSARAPTRTFKFQVVNDQLFTPLMAYTAIVNTLSSYERQFGAATYAVTGKASLGGYDSIAFNNIFAGENPSSGAAAYVVAPLTALMANDYERVELKGLDLAFTSTEEPRTATLERVWLDDPRPRAGKTVPLKILLRSYRGEEIVRTVPIEIPANATGTLSLVASDGARLGQAESREARPTQPRSVSQIVRTLNKARRNNAVYVKLLSSDTGAVVRGELLSSLPPSVLGVIEADRTGGSVNLLHSATLGEWEIPTEQAVSGIRTLTVAVAQD